MTDHRDEETRTATVQTEHPPDAVAPAQTLGRYLVLSEVGRGGMGRVYAAYDPRLDRRVAVKVLHAGDGPKERKRFLREAKALARLSHPNVVTVHEVEELDSQVLLALEFVQGSTLKGWLAKNPPNGNNQLRTTLRLLIQAGQGLIAAHTEGLIHRDFKPSNVLVGDDGRVRVADFGLARPSAPPPSTDKEEEPETIEALGGPLDTRITQTGGIIGTPAYMAPEQWVRGGTLDARTDQFSFCLVAWEAIFGVRPDVDGAPVSPLTNVEAHRSRHADKAAVLTDVVSALQRGLSPRRSRRFPELRNIVSALELAAARLDGSATRTGRKRPWKLLGAIVLCAGVLVAGREFNNWRKTQVCNDTADSAKQRIWSKSHRDTVRDAISQSTTPNASTTAEETLEALDTRVAEWVNDLNKTCRREGTDNWSLDTAKKSDFCLHKTGRKIRWLASRLERGTPHITSYAKAYATTLSTKDECTDADRLKEHPTPPPRENWSKVSLIHDEIRDIATATDSTPEQLKRLKELELKLAENGEKGDIKKTISRKLLELGFAKEAARTGQEAFLDAVSRGSWFAASELASLVGHISSNELGREDEALLWIGLARASLERSTTKNTFLLHQTYHSEANILLQSGNPSRALDAALLQFQLGKKVQGEDLSTRGLGLLNIGIALRLLRQYNIARQFLEEARTEFTSSLGPTHPHTGAAIRGIARTSLESGALRTARRDINTLVTFLDAAKIQDPELPVTLVTLGRMSFQNGDISEALSALEAAVQKCSELSSCPVSFETKTQTLALRIAAESGSSSNIETLIPRLKRSLSDEQASQESRFFSNAALAYAALALSRDNEALFFARAAASAAASTPKFRSRAMRTLAICEWRSGDQQAGEARLRDAINYDLDPLQGNNCGAATSRLALAELLWGAGQQREQAFDIIRSARDTLASSPPSMATWKAEEDDYLIALSRSTTWLARHGALGSE